MKKAQNMKTKRVLSRTGLALVLAFSLEPLALVRAATTITTTNRYAYGANFGWVDACANTNNGVVIGEYVCSGYLYAANVGWINLGSGSPTNGIQYQNTPGTDFGVNLDAPGHLSGYAWGANIGWVNFVSNGAPKVDLATGKLSGYAWSANCGWLSLSNASAVVQTGSIAPGADTDGDGIADAWERIEFGDLTSANATSDYDQDGMTDLQEYLAATNPSDSYDALRITRLSRNPGGVANRVVLEWMSVPTRCYAIERSTNVSSSSAWSQYSTGFENLLGWHSVVFDDTSTRRFYRIRAVQPLGP